MVKFEQNRMIQTAQNVKVFDKKLVTMLTIFVSPELCSVRETM